MWYFKSFNVILGLRQRHICVIASQNAGRRNFMSRTVDVTTQIL